jgi:23S rRNA pseudouridine2604 synthase
LALRGQATRRAADKLIAAGKVSINGRIAKLGDKVNAKDKVEIAERPAIKYTYLTYHKPNP